MFKKFSFSNHISKEEEIKIIRSDISRTCRSIEDEDFIVLDICDYNYDIDDAVEELGLDKETIQQFVESYVVQILKTVSEFEKLISELENKKYDLVESDYISLKELAHKNLGVARNLRIQDAQKLLSELMKKNDLKYLRLCLEVLEATAIRLSANTAYNTLHLLKIQSN